MVQKKVATKPENQALHLCSSQNPLQTLKPSPSKPSSSLDYVKNRGGSELQKKMKKSGSAAVCKRSNSESFGSMNLRKHVPQPQPGKPPPTPNYMKSTTSSHARTKESTSQSQVSSRSSQAILGSTKLSVLSKDSSSALKICSASSSGAKPGRGGLARTCSLEKVRTLTKTPTFKPARSSPAKPCSAGVVFCQKFDVCRATCSSTMKGCDFPDYLELCPGGTESEGTTVFKVCPYTYCSLNGHHRPALPPLKCFLSARRRALKSQKCMKLSGIQSKPQCSPNSAEEIAAPNEQRDFFLEIYAKEKEEVNDFTLVLSPADGLSFIATDSSANCSSDGSEAEGEVKGLFNDSFPPRSDDDKNMNHDGDVISIRSGIMGFCPEGHPSGVAQTENQHEEVDSGLSDEGSVSDSTECYAYSLDDEVSDLNRQEMIDDIEGSDTEEVSTEMRGDESVFLSDGSYDIASYSSDEIQASDMMLQFSDVENAMNSEILSCGIVSDQQNDAHSPDTVSDPDMGDDKLATNPEGVALINRFEEGLQEVIDMDDSTPTHHQIDIIDDDDGAAVFTSEGGDDHEWFGLVELYEAYSNCIENHEGIAEASDSSVAPELLGADKENEIILAKTSLAGGVTFGSLVGSSSDIDETGLHDESSDEELQTRDADEACLSKLSQHAASGKPCVGNGINENESEISKMHKGMRLGRQTEEEESTEFNPRDPNFLPLEDDPEAEKVDLKHQLIDERKAADEWMIDYALRQTVTKLAPARNRKVALLVEAFETVMPIPKWSARYRQPAATFGHSRPIQACS